MIAEILKHRYDYYEAKTAIMDELDDLSKSTAAPKHICVKHTRYIKCYTLTKNAYRVTHRIHADGNITEETNLRIYKIQNAPPLTLVDGYCDPGDLKIKTSNPTHVNLADPKSLTTMDKLFKR